MNFDKGSKSLFNYRKSNKTILMICNACKKLRFDSFSMLLPLILNQPIQLMSPTCVRIHLV